MTDPKIINQYKMDYLPNNSGKAETDFMDVIGQDKDGRLFLLENETCTWQPIKETSTMTGYYDALAGQPGGTHSRIFCYGDETFSVDGDQIPDFVKSEAHMIDGSDNDYNPVSHLYVNSDNAYAVHKDWDSQILSEKWQIPSDSEIKNGNNVRLKFNSTMLSDINQDGVQDKVEIEQYMLNFGQKTYGTMPDVMADVEIYLYPTPQ